MLLFVADPGGDRQRHALALIVAGVITAAWAVGFLVNILDRTYQPPAYITPLMGSVCVFLFGLDAITRRKG